jgi:hypothetical protein
MKPDSGGAVVARTGQGFLTSDDAHRGRNDGSVPALLLVLDDE